ncbi:MAG: DUF4260 domain-containing protein [Chitinophagaceae bacterium]|nr:DUF4260 domain-containing protein [Chitinophagaceae bacterium]
MKTILKLEELAMLVACIVLLAAIGVEWWMYIILFLGPDVSMLGYVAGNKVGAWCYNVFHHKGIAIALAAAGYTMDNWLLIAGIVLFGHASMDRVAGYGLKYENGFKFTHLGEIGKK